MISAGNTVERLLSLSYANESYMYGRVYPKFQIMFRQAEITMLDLSLAGPSVATASRESALTMLTGENADALRGGTKLADFHKLRGKAKTKAVEKVRSFSRHNSDVNDGWIKPCLVFGSNSPILQSRALLAVILLRFAHNANLFDRVWRNRKKNTNRFVFPGFNFVLRLTLPLLPAAEGGGRVTSGLY